MDCQHFSCRSILAPSRHYPDNLIEQRIGAGTTIPTPMYPKGQPALAKERAGSTIHQKTATRRA